MGWDRRRTEGGREQGDEGGEIRQKKRGEQKNQEGRTVRREGAKKKRRKSKCEVVLYKMRSD